jgi:alpha-L-fucosidase
MKIIHAITLLCCLSAWPLIHASTATQDSAVTQRGDSCVIMEVSQAKADGNSLVWNIELNQPGNYVVQIVVATDKGKGEPSGTVEIDGATLSKTPKKVYRIEDGIVSEFDQPVVFETAGTHTLKLQAGMALTKVRLVPQGYVKSRIEISSSKYYDEWIKLHESPEKIAAMEWYQQARFGMFIHWGVYSEAAGSWKGKPIEQGQGPKVAEWLMFAFKISRADYREYAKHFNPDKSFAVNIARLAKATGMKYVVITAKHHDGFALFNSAHSDFDISGATPYQGDLIKELYDACRAEGLDFGVYYSHGHDWADGCDADYANVKKSNDIFGVPTRPHGKNLWDPSPNTYLEYLENKAYPQVAELIKLLPDLRLIWFDGEGLITEAQAFRFYRMIYEMNPNIIVNRRVGYDFGDYVDAGDNKTPAANALAAKHFETCGTANHSWGFKANDHDWKTSRELLRNFLDIVSKGGNYLLNVGPDGKGKVPEPCVKNFQEMGAWVRTNAEAIFGTTRWTTFHEGGTGPGAAKKAPANAEPSAAEFWFSAKGDKVYAMSLAPAVELVQIHSLQQSAGTVVNVRLLGSAQRLKWSQNDQALELDFQGVVTGVNGYAVEVTLKP